MALANRPVIILPRALTDLESIVEYLFSEFGEKVANDLLKRFEEVLDNIAYNPEIYSVVNKKRNTRKCVLNKQNIVYFRIYKRKVEIQKIFDTRQNPGKLHKL